MKEMRLSLFSLPLRALFSFMLYAMPSKQKDHKKSEITKKKIGSVKV